MPTALHLAKNNWRGKRRLKNGEPMPAVSAPQCPEWMPDDGRQEWNRIVGELLKFGLVTQWDLGALAVYCQAFAEFAAAVRDGSFAARDIAAKRLLSASDRFGLSPASRTRVQAAKQAGKVEDGKAEFFRKQG